jgi:hypothetical protein
VINVSYSLKIIRAYYSLKFANTLLIHLPRRLTFLERLTFLTFLEFLEHLELKKIIFGIIC